MGSACSSNNTTGHQQHPPPQRSRSYRKAATRPPPISTRPEDFKEKPLFPLEPTPNTCQNGESNSPSNDGRELLETLASDDDHLSDRDADVDADLSELDPKSRSLQMSVGKFIERLRNKTALSTDETYILQEIISLAAKSANLNFGSRDGNNSFSTNSHSDGLHIHVPEVLGSFKPMKEASPGRASPNADPRLISSFSTPQAKPRPSSQPVTPMGDAQSIGLVSRKSSGAFGGMGGVGLDRKSSGAFGAERRASGSRGEHSTTSMMPESTLTSQEGNRRVKNSWAITVNYPDCPSLVYRALLSKYPEATEALFYGVNIEKQSAKLVEMITTGIDLMDKPDMFITVMLQLGSRHVLYAVEGYHFDMFNVAVFHAVELALKRKMAESNGDLAPELHWGPVLQGEWHRVLTLMKTVLLQGYNTPQGLSLAKKQAVRIKTMLNKCWQSVVKAEDDYEESFVYILHNLGRVRIGHERADMFTGLVTRHRQFMSMISRVFEAGPDDDQAKVMLKELGARHVAYRVEDSDFSAHAIPFVEAIKMRADPKTFNPFVRNQLLNFWKKVTGLMVEGAYESTHSFELRYAPKELPFAMVFTDIESSTSLWEKYPIQMKKAVQRHHRLIRDLISDHHGYEVKTIGDSFMIAFQSLQDAFLLAMRVQVHLLRMPIDEFEMNETCESSGPDTVWNKSTLRVRIGVHWCQDANPMYDVVHRGYDYYGRDVNAAARIQDIACGGQTVCTEETLLRFRAIARLGELTKECGDLLDIYPAKTTKEMTYHEQQKGAGGGVTEASILSDTPFAPPMSVKKKKASLNDVFKCAEYKRNVTLSGIDQTINLYSIYPGILEDRVYGERKKKVKQEGSHAFKNWEDMAASEGVEGAGSFSHSPLIFDELQ